MSTDIYRYLAQPICLHFPHPHGPRMATKTPTEIQGMMFTRWVHQVLWLQNLPSSILMKN